MPRPHCFLHENPKFAANQPQNFAMRRARIQRDSSRAARRGYSPHRDRHSGAIPAFASPAQPGASIARPQRGYSPHRDRHSGAYPRVRFTRKAAARLFSASRQAQRRNPRVRFVRAAQRVTCKAIARLLSASRQAQRRTSPRSLRPRSPARQSQSRGAVTFRIATGTAARIPASASSAQPQRVNRMASMRLLSTPRQAQRRISPCSLRPRSSARYLQGSSAVIFPHHR